MQINRLHIIEIQHRPLLQGLDISFYSPSDTTEGITPQCFIGVNGSGKSQLLETLAEIFLHLDKIYRKVNRTIAKAPLLYELEYTILKESQLFKIKVAQEAFNKAPIFYRFDEEDQEILFDNLADIEDYLPQKVIGYTSGDNETLSLPFSDYYDEYADHTTNRALKGLQEEDYEPRLYLMDYSTNIGVVVSNLLLDRSQVLKNMLKEIKLSKLQTFQIKIQLKHRGPKKEIKLTKDLKNWIINLKKSATCYEYYSETETYILDFFNTEATQNALRHYFTNALSLYTALYKIELLNSLIIDKKYRTEIKKQRTQRRLLVKPPTISEQDKVLSYHEVRLVSDKHEVIDYISLSDGEHQFLNVFGTVLMTNYNNSIYLLDEPETHFNPKWRREFINQLNLLTKGRSQAYFITSHSPFIVSDSRREQVHIFKRDENNKLVIEQPSKETYGSNFDYILKIAFGMEDTVSEKSLDEIRELQKSKNIEEIEDKLDEYGESAEKFYLYSRIEELKSKEA